MTWRLLLPAPENTTGQIPFALRDGTRVHTGWVVHRKQPKFEPHKDQSEIPTCTHIVNRARPNLGSFGVYFNVMSHMRIPQMPPQPVR